MRTPARSVKKKKGREMVEVEHVLSIGNELGEGPLWSQDEKKLYWVDIMAGNVHRMTPGQDDLETFSLGQPVGSLGFREKGGFIAALKNGFHFWEPAAGRLEFLADPEADKSHPRFNDGAVDRQGRFWAGTMDDNGHSALYRYDPDGSVHVMQPGVTCSNGIGWSPDNRIMYYSDSQIFTIFAYDFDLASGTITNRRVFHRFDNGDPDGLTVDSEGFLWVAIWGGWCIERYDPAGKMVERIDMPVQYTTCPTFGGENLDELYLTSAWIALGPDRRHEQPQAGDLFRIRPGVRGLAEPKFAG
jgi:sugar lactone lactonase YvrE